MIAVSYARTSGESGDSVSIASQHKANQKFADSMGIEIAYKFDEEFTGTKLDRPKLSMLRQLIIQGKINAVIVYSTDRLARSEYVAGYLLQEIFAPNGIRLFISSGYKEVDPNNPDSVLMFSVESSFSAHEARKIKERTGRGKRELLEEGIWVGEGKTDKYGYQREGNKRNTVITRVEDELAIVALTFDLFVNENIGVQRIVDEYNRKGITTPGSKKGMLWNSRSTWHKAMVYRILKEEAYVGRWAAKRYKRVPNGNGGYKHVPLPQEEWVYINMPHTRIVSDELFNAAQKKLEEGRAMNAPLPKQQYLLARRCKCGECGYAMFSKTAGRWKEKSYSYYTCGGREEKRSSCTLPSVSVNKVDAKVWSTLELFLRDSSYRRATLLAAQEQQIESRKEAIEMLEGADRVKARFTDEVYRLTELYTEGLINKDTFKRKKAELDEKLAGADRVVQEYQDALGDDFLGDREIDRIDKDMEAIAEELDRLGDLSFDRRRQLVDTMGVTTTFQREALADGYSYYTVRVYVHGVSIGHSTLSEESSLNYLTLQQPRRVLIGVIRLQEA